MRDRNTPTLSVRYIHCVGVEIVQLCMGVGKKRSSLELFGGLSSDPLARTISRMTSKMLLSLGLIAAVSTVRMTLYPSAPIAGGGIKVQSCRRPSGQ